MELPNEILVLIFKLLTKSDRKSASETCRSWYLAANDNCFLKNKVAVFFKTNLSDENSPIYTFVNSIILHNNYYFSEVEITAKLDEIWDKIGDNIHTITLKNCDICEKVFVSILQRCTNLKSLNVLSCRELFMSGRLLEGKTEGLLTLTMENLKCLNLSGNQYLTDSLVNRFIRCAPSLEHLNMSACSLQFHQGLIKKFYPAGTDVFANPSESVLTFYFLLQFIVHRAKYIKHLWFSNTLIDGTALKCLSEIINLKLESIKLQSCDQLTNTGILALTMYQTSLKELDLGFCSRVTDKSLLHISENLINLESLNIQRCRAVTDLGIAELSQLKKIKHLNISQCELVTKDGIEKGLCSRENLILQELDIHSLNIDQSVLIMLSEKLLNLKLLDVSYCFNAVTDASIQVIFKNLLYLQVLKMSHCDKVTDAGLTGMGKVETDSDEEIPSMSDYAASSAFRKIHLGSKAEEEIVLDARRKHEVMNMCKKIAIDNYTGYSLAQMKYLRELDISGCNRITDVSLIYTFNFIELNNLNLSRCQQITHEGMIHLVNSCPSIEELNLIDCYNLKDEAVIEIVKGLTRLLSLELRGCNQLTDRTLEAVQTFCKKLKFLDVRGCRNMSPELGCNISIPTLHTVLMSKPGPYITPSAKNRSPAPTFLPALMRKLRLH